MARSATCPALPDILEMVGGTMSSITEAGISLALEFAPEAGVIQTRFISAALLAMRMLAGDEDGLETLPEQVGQTLTELDPALPGERDHIVFLGRDWRFGLAVSASLNLQ